MRRFSDITAPQHLQVRLFRRCTCLQSDSGRAEVSTGEPTEVRRPH
jgi:hypothetical protein